MSESEYFSCKVLCKWEIVRTRLGKRNALKKWVCKRLEDYDLKVLGNWKKERASGKFGRMRE